MNAESPALTTALPTTHTEAATAGHGMLPASWDVRIDRYVSETQGETLLRLLLIGAGGQVLARPAVTRLAPAVSVPWLGSLHVTRVPVHVSEKRMSADGVVDIMSVGSGTTEVRVCLWSTKRRDLRGRRRRLTQLARNVSDELVYLSL